MSTCGPVLLLTGGCELEERIYIILTVCPLPSHLLPDMYFACDSASYVT